MNKPSIEIVIICLTSLLCVAILWLGPLRYKLEATGEGKTIFILDTFSGELMYAGPVGVRIITSIK
ncbi:hypothetical protein [Bilophila wadsworthia]|uniref:Uncharacterized protein n=1 Tax=Podoviridae sp. ctIlO27 TaxID=2825238 RepID=A0A8S5PYR3_9CAUD|nr:hypothetical protein [Bilophila wadsworthia]DAE11753.1 MAG TPA: hypothetical protein [Podoviridae sp. ctIlO27]